MADLSKFHFDSLKIPGVCLAMIADGEITPTEALLLAIIDGMTSWKGEGCWASHADISKFLNVRPDYVRDLIRKLKRQGLIEQTGTKTVGYNEMPVLVVFYSKSQKFDRREGGDKTPTPPGIKPPPPGDISPPIVKKKQHKTKGNSQPPRPSGTRGENPRVSRSSNDKQTGDFSTNKVAVPSILEGKRYKSASQTMAEQLYDTVSRSSNGHPQRKPKLGTWAEIFTDLIGKNGLEEVKSTLDWYCKNYPKRVELYIPDCETAQTFSLRFVKIQNARVRTLLDQSKRNKSGQQKDPFGTDEVIYGTPKGTTKGIDGKTRDSLTGELVDED